MEFNTMREDEDHLPIGGEATFSYEEGDDDDDDSDDDCEYDSSEENNHIRNNNNGAPTSELKQHFVAVVISIIAAIIAHSYTHGGCNVWKEELVKDWASFKLKFSTVGTSNNEVYPTPIENYAPFAAPSMDGIPTTKRKDILNRAMNRETNIQGANSVGGGHEKARNYRRTRSLSFCPNNGSKMEFILPIDPSVRVLHLYYLADALKVDSNSMVYDYVVSSSEQLGKDVGSLGSYTSDTILNEIDNTMATNNNDEELTFDQVHSILQSYLPASMINRQHVCLLHQYTINKSSGRSIRGTTKVYNRPHVSTFYRDKWNTQQTEPNYKISAASLSFTGYAAKFINLSVNDIHLYWEGGRIQSGPREGKIHTELVGIIKSMESVGTASFPGHAFYVTPTYDKETALQRWTITEDDSILYYDPFGNLSIEDQKEEIQKLSRQGKLSDKQLFHRDAWMLDRSFGRDYLIKTGQVWLANFPQPYLAHDDDVSNVDEETASQVSHAGDNMITNDVGNEMHMWQASFIGQTHMVETSSLYYTALPNRLDRLTKNDYLPTAEEKRMLEMRKFQSSDLKGKGNDNENDTTTTMPLTLKVLSCAPRVLETKRFLSPVEAQHLIDLATGVKGDVVMKPSTVSASNVKVNNKKKVRGGSDARSSTGGWIHREQDVIVDTIFRRIADLLNVDEQLMRDQDRDQDSLENDEELLPTHDRIVEAMQLVRYGPGEEYSAHHDFTYPSIEDRYQPKRYATVLLYLTGEGDVVENGVRHSTKFGDKGLEGGGTTFPRAVTTDFHDGIKIKPQSGKAVVFYDVLPDGNFDQLSQHAGEKVEQGVKYVANVWVWDPVVS